MTHDLESDLLQRVARTRSSFAMNGAVCVRRAFSREWLDALERGVATNLARPGPFARCYTPDGGAGMYRDFLERSPAARIAGTLVASRKVNLFSRTRARQRAGDA